MALIKCKECGKEISDKIKTCIHCGCPVEQKIKCKECGKELNITDKKCNNCGFPIKNKTNYNNEMINFFKKNYKILMIIIVILILLFLIIKIFTPKPNIIGIWERCSYLPTGTYFCDEYEFKNHGKAYHSRTVGKNKNEWECNYKFRRNNTEIKITCNYDTKEARDKNNVWVNFEKSGDKIYIDNEEFK